MGRGGPVGGVGRDLVLDPDGGRSGGVSVVSGSGWGRVGSHGRSTPSSVVRGP